MPAFHMYKDLILYWSEVFVLMHTRHLGSCQCCSFRLVEKYGEGQWSLISTFFPGRIGKQCRERWHHQLNPKINRNAWSVEEERIIVAAHKVCSASLGSAITLCANGLALCQYRVTCLDMFVHLFCFIDTMNHPSLQGRTFADMCCFCWLQFALHVSSKVKRI